MAPTIERKTCTAPDGVTIVYSAAGKGKVGLLFVHGGLANRRFYDHELRTFAAEYRAIAPDLAGHGESGADRRKWGMPEFGADIRAVVDAEHLDKVILFGNSLGGPAAIEGALLLPGRAVGVVGVDTFHSLGTMTLEDARKRAEAFRADYAGSIKEMVKVLLHKDTDSALIADAERRMTGTPVEAACNIFLSLAGYDWGTSARRLTIPLRAINGDLYPTDRTSVRQVKADFDVVVMKHVGHYPMLEQPVEFDRHVAAMATTLLQSKGGAVR